MAESHDRTGGVDPLEFRGSIDAPDDLTRIMERPPVLGNAKSAPEEVRRAVTERRIWLPGSPRRKPEIDLHRVDDGWELAFDAAEPHRPGLTAERLAPAEVLRGIRPGVGLESHRPEWVSASYHPRPALRPDGPELLRRFGRGATKPLYVFGGDDRAVYRDATWPWGLVGKIFTSDGYTGTGALIGPRTVATAGHMVPWGKPGWWMRFVPAYYDGSSLHGRGFESYVSDARGYDVHGDVTGYDWAVLRLYQPLGSWLGYFGYNGFSDSWENQNRWTLLGYPGAVAGGQRPSRQLGTSVFDTDSDSNGGSELETQADMTPGNSGGPYFGWFNGDPRLVGVVSGQETEWSPGFWPWEWADTQQANVVAGGSGFTGLMAWGRSTWPA